MESLPRIVRASFNFNIAAACSERLHFKSPMLCSLLALLTSVPMLAQHSTPWCLAVDVMIVMCPHLPGSQDAELQGCDDVTVVVGRPRRSFGAPLILAVVPWTCQRTGCICTTAWLPRWTLVRGFSLRFPTTGSEPRSFGVRSLR